MEKDRCVVAKNGATYFTELPHFAFKEQWDDFISRLDMDNENIRLLVEEVEYQREQVAKYYEYYLEKEL